MIILFDTNVILDGLLDREPFGKMAALLFNAVEESIITGFICANSITTLFYLMQKAKNQQFARQKVKALLDLFEIAPVNRAVLEDAIRGGFHDYEDGVVYQAALTVRADSIVTRNTVDFKTSKIPIFSPAELLTAINQK
jgi:predicted nucleic acid-binding protein